MEFRLLGPLEVIEGGQSRPIGGPKQRTALVHLILRANHDVPPERLIEEIWGADPPPAARSTLRGYLSHLRGALGPGMLEHRSGGYVLHADPPSIDAVRFEGLVVEARAVAEEDPAVAARGLSSALQLWRGPALDDLADQPSLQPEIARLEELRLAATEERIGAELELGGHAELIPDLEALVASHPFRERLWGHLITALYRSGRQADALAAFHRARDVLAEELGIDPSPELRSLQERILRQDPSLDVGGEPLRGYRLLEEIGEGGSGVVYRAIQPQVHRDVAVKAIRPYLANHPDFIRDFEAEAQLVARLEHPHVVPLYDYWREPGAAYLVMRYLRGGNLAEAIAKGPLELEWVARLLDQVCGALAAAHRRGFVHRDVKPSNILLDEEGNAYLADFGIAKDISNADRTQPGTMKGSLLYLAPEQIRGEPITPRTDVYALGVVLYEALVGDHPFADAPDLAVYERHLSDPLPPVRHRRPELPPAVDDVIATATAKVANHRFRDAMSLAGAFRKALPASTLQGAEAPLLEARNPYKGLRPFTEADVDDFYGREAFVERLLERWRSPAPQDRFLAIVGPSGSGKSSVIRAGFVPALRRGAIDGSREWFITDLVPGRHPMEELDAALLRVAAEPPPGQLQVLESGPRGLLQAVDRVIPRGAELLLLVDQFEELFTLTEDEAERSALLEALRVAAADPASRVRIVVTLRADFYDRPLNYPRFGELLGTCTEVVTPLAPDELERAIVRPASAVGMTVDPALVAQVASDVAEQPGTLPLVQYALTELFDRRQDGRLTLEAYRAIGGVGGALAGSAEHLFVTRQLPGRSAVRELFLRLVTLGEGTPDTRRRVRLSELAAVEGDPEAMESALDAYGRHRLLTFDRDPGTREPTVEVAHEALLSAWDRLRGWIDEARDDIRVRNTLASAAADWEGAGRDESFLLRGARLERIASWAETTTVSPSPGEAAYLEASLARRDEERAAEAERAARERVLERRSIRRLRGIVAVVTAAALLASMLTAIALEQRGQARREAQVATARELAAAAVANLEVDPELSILLAIKAVETTRSADGSVLPAARDALHRAVTASRLALQVPGLGGLLTWSPRGVFVTEGPEDSGLIDIRDAETGERVHSFQGHEGDVNDVAFSPDGSLLASTGKDGTLKVWDASTWRLVSSLSSDGEAWGPSFSADGSRVSAVWNGDQVFVLDLSDDQVVSEIRLPFAIDTALSPDGTRVAVATFFAGGGGTGAVFDVSTGEEAFALRGLNRNPTPASRGVSWSPDGRHVAVSSMDTARIWNATTGALQDTLAGHTGLVLSLAWSPDSTHLLTGSADGTVKVWEPGREGDQERWSLSAEDLRSGVTGVAFSPDGTWVMAGNASLSVVKVWDLGPTGDAEWANLPAAGRPAAEFMQDGQHVVTTNPEGADFESGRSITIWDLQAGGDPRTIGPAADFFQFLGSDVSPDGGSIALGGRSTNYGGKSAARAWDTLTGEELYRFGHALDVNEVALSPDGAYMATASWDGTAKIVDRSGRVIQVLGEFNGDPHPGDFVPYDVAFSSDGYLVATAESNLGEARVRIWDWARGEVVRTIGAGGVPPVVDLDPTGPRAVLTGSEGLAEVRDLNTGALVAVLNGPPGGVKDLAFSPDGSRIATAGFDGRVRLFDADTGTPQLVLQGSGCAVEGVSFSPDGTKLVSSSACDGARIWALDIDDLLEIARGEAGRSLSDEECRQYLHMDRCSA